MMLQKQLRDAQETRQEEQQSGCRLMFLVGLPLSVPKDEPRITGLLA